MSTKIETPKADKKYLKKLLIVTSILTAIFAFLGAYVISQGWGYFDASLVYFLVAFVLALVGFYITMLVENVPLIVISLVVGIASLFLMNNSFDWRRAYIDNGFILEAYIGSYPSYGELLMSKITTPKKDLALVNFADDCIGTLNKPVERFTRPETCQTVNGINSYYSTDLFGVMIDYHRKMASTAKRIKEGQAMQIAYPMCINTKRCAYVPLPPADIEENVLANTKDAQLVILRDGFWELIEERSITPNVCANMFLCNRLVDLGILSASEFQALRKRQDPSFELKNRFTQ